MRWPWLALPIAALITSNASAQTKPGPKPTEKPEGWSNLEVEPETPDPVPTAPKPKPRDDSPYRPKPTPLQPEPPPPPGSEGEKTEVVANDSAGGPTIIEYMKEWKPRFAVRHVRLEFDVWDHDLGTSFMWDVGVSAGVEDVPVLLDVVLPWTYFDSDAPRVNPETGEVVSGHTHIGNTTLGVHGGGVAADVVGFWGGAWIGIPSGKAISSLNEETLLLAYGARNGVEGHRFFPDSIPLRWAFGIDGQAHPLVYLRSEFYTTILFPNEKLEGNISIPGTFEQIHELEVLSPVGAGAGLRYQTLFNVTNSLSPDAVHGIEPYFSYQPPYIGPFAFDLFARLGFLFSLSDLPGNVRAPVPTPQGPLVVAPGSVLTIRTQVGYRF